MNRHISKRLRFSLVAALLFVWAHLLSSCSISRLTTAEKANMRYWRQADRYVGKDLRWSDSWCKVAWQHRGHITLQRSSDSGWELANMQFPRDTVVTRELIMGGRKVYPTTYYKVLK